MQELQASPVHRDFTRSVIRLLRENNYSLCGTNVLVMCSGGSDSVMLARIIDALPRGSRPSAIELLFCDHGLRDTSMDERIVRDIGVRLDVPVHVVRAPVGSLAATAQVSHIGLHAAAREWRYAEAQAAAHRVGADTVLVGHTADDQVETVLHRLLSSGGERSISGMQVVAARDGVPIVRPLLAVGREQLRSEAVRIGVSWIDDPANDDLEYRRSRLRHTVIPELVRAYPGAAQALIRSSRAAAASSGASASLARAWLASHGEAPVHIPTLTDLPTSSRHEVIATWLRDNGVGRDLSTRVVYAIDELVLGGRTHGIVAVGDACVRRDGYDLRFTPTQEPSGDPT